MTDHAKQAAERLLKLWEKDVSHGSGFSLLEIESHIQQTIDAATAELRAELELCESSLLRQEELGRSGMFVIAGLLSDLKTAERKVAGLRAEAEKCREHEAQMQRALADAELRRKCEAAVIAIHEARLFDEQNLLSDRQQAARLIYAAMKG